MISDENLGWVLGQMSQTQILLWFLKEFKTKPKSGSSKQGLNVSSILYNYNWCERSGYFANTQSAQ
jgi:hypothetical protein